jgi:hypothetical protein
MATIMPSGAHIKRPARAPSPIRSLLLNAASSVNAKMRPEVFTLRKQRLNRQAPPTTPKGPPLRRPCQQGRQNSSRVPGFSLLLLTRSWLDRPRLCSRVAAAIGRTSGEARFATFWFRRSPALGIAAPNTHRASAANEGAGAQRPNGSALASMWPVSAAQITCFASRASNPRLARRAGRPCL